MLAFPVMHCSCSSVALMPRFWETERVRGWLTSNSGTEKKPSHTACPQANPHTKSHSHLPTLPPLHSEALLSNPTRVRRKISASTFANHSHSLLPFLFSCSPSKSIFPLCLSSSLAILFILSTSSALPFCVTRLRKFSSCTVLYSLIKSPSSLGSAPLSSGILLLTMFHYSFRAMKPPTSN